MLFNEATAAFIRLHCEDDVHQLALSGASSCTSSSRNGEEVDKAMALQQIAGWQTARKKLPTWAAVEGIVYPPHLNMEQCSSEQTARYKASLLPSPSTLIDLTGGFGVDFYFMARALATSPEGMKGKALYVEQNPQLCALAEHNFRVLGLECSVVCGSAADILPSIAHAACIYLDPARRDSHGARTYSIEDCTPNVLELLPLLREKADRIVFKLSPMLDWHKAVSDLGGVSEVHIVSVGNECKELLLVLRGERKKEERGERREERGEKNDVRGMLYCVNFLSDGRMQCFETSFEAPSLSSPSTLHLPPSTLHLPPSTLHLPPSTLHPLNSSFLYEPNSSIMKAGCFDEIADFYHIQELAANSHLFVSAEEVPDFPGRRFRVEKVSTMNKREWKEALSGVTHANIAVRNFPMGATELRKRLRLKDGGEVYIFATTLADGQHRLLICRKIG